MLVLQVFFGAVLFFFCFSLLIWLWSIYILLLYAVAFYSSSFFSSSLLLLLLLLFKPKKNRNKRQHLQRICLIKDLHVQLRTISQLFVLFHYENECNHYVVSKRIYPLMVQLFVGYAYEILLNQNVANVLCLLDILDSISMFELMIQERHWFQRQHPNMNAKH